MNILIVEPFFTGSHQKWAQSYQQFSKHRVNILSLPGRHWKWRMYGGAVSLAEKFLSGSFQPDVLIASDMLDLGAFTSLCRKRLQYTRIFMYFHENQITYPWSPNDPDLILGRNNQYGFINYTSALCADFNFFNSQYHLTSFTTGLQAFLKQFPDHCELQNIEKINQKSAVLYLGIDLHSLEKYKMQHTDHEAIILWNHRWEYDKNPDLFFETLFRLKTENIAFKLIVLGKSYGKIPPIFNEAKVRLKEQILHFGYAQSFQQYAQLLWQSDILPVTSNQDFFGGSLIEAMYCDTYPLLPNRLAYPEHIPAENFDEHFYNTGEELYQKLKTAVLNIQQMRAGSSNKNFVARYDWSILAPVYDHTFEKKLNDPAIYP